MKTKNLLKFACSLAVVSCAFITALSANAKAEATAALVYNEAESTSQTASISLVVTDFGKISTYNALLTAGEVAISDFEATYGCDGVLHSYADTDYTKEDLLIEGNVFVGGLVSGTSDATLPEDGKIFTYKLTFAEPLTEDVTISFVEGLVEKDNGDNFVDLTDVSVTVKANPNAGGGSTGGGETGVPFPGTGALTKLDRYDDYTNTVPVDAWSTTIDWSAYNAVNKLYWSISNGSETKKVEAKMADVTGGIETVVTYGLAIAGRADELDTITEVKLVVE